MTIIRAVLAAVVALGLVATPLTLEAQPATKIRRIGVLWVWSPRGAPTLVNALREGLHERALDGTDVTMEWRFADGQPERLPALATELVRAGCDVIVAATTPAALAARNATKTVPIVFTLVQDPVGSGLVASLARPKGNLTGLTNINPEIMGKRLALLKEAIPRMRRIAILVNPSGGVVNAPVLKEAETAARSIGVQLQIVEIRDPTGFERTFAAFKGDRIDAAFAVPNPMVTEHAARIADHAIKDQVPLMGWARDHAEAGMLLSYGPDQPDMFRRVAGFVDKIFKGAKPADLPVEQPTKLDLVINMKTAKALGLTIPPPLLLQANLVLD